MTDLGALWAGEAQDPTLQQVQVGTECGKPVAAASGDFQGGGPLCTGNSAGACGRSPAAWA